MLNRELLKHWTYKVFAPGALLRARYEAFRELLVQDEACLEEIAQLEDIQYGSRAVDWARVVHLVQELEAGGHAIAAALTTLSPSKGVALQEYFRKIAFYLKLAVDIPPPDASPPFVLPLHRDHADVARMGGKAANLARALHLNDLPVPPGFVITAGAFHYFLESGDLRPRLDDLLRRLDLDDPDGLELTAQALQAIILETEIPAPVMEEMDKALASLPDPAAPLAVRSSAVAEDAANSFAGQYDSFLSVSPEGLAEAWKRTVLGKYTPRALTYRILTGLADTETPMAVLVMPMVEAAFAGVCYTDDSDRSGSLCGVTALYAVPGLGENLVSGRVTPGVFCIDTEGAPASPPAILQRPPGFVALADSVVTRLALMARQLEKFFGAPQDVEWAVDRQGKPWVLQTRPMQRGHSAKAAPMPDTLPEPLLAEGFCVSPGTAGGQVFHARTPAAIAQAPPGAILVTESMPPTLVRIMGRVAAVVSARGSRASHFASVAREFGLPVIVGGPSAFEALPEGLVVTLDAARGHVFPGLINAAAASPVPRKSMSSAAQARLSKLMPHAASLTLTDPASPNFSPEHCRSAHDVVRFAHETAVREMFTLVGKSARGLARAKKLKTSLPLSLYVLDLGDGLFPAARNKPEIEPDDITSVPMWTLWWGISSVPVAGPPLADWESLDRHSGGVLLSDRLLASYAVIDGSYAHLMLRFGYHFCVIDALCEQDGDKNHAAMRFMGGGGHPGGRRPRLEFLRLVLEELGFQTSITGDLFEARLAEIDCNTLRRRLVALGRLVMEARLMDIRLETLEQAEAQARRFLDSSASPGD